MQGVSSTGVALLLSLVAAASACNEVRLRPEAADGVGPDEATPEVDGNAEAAVTGQMGTLGLPEALRPIAISAGYYNTCVVLADRRVACFGDNASAFGRDDVDGDLELVAGFTDRTGVSVGRRRGCGWGEDGRFMCWNAGAYPNTMRRGRSHHVPETRHTAVGGGHECAVVGEAGKVRCFGNDEWLQTHVPSYRSDGWVPGVEGAVEVALGATHSCARHDDGGVSCWGDNRQNQMGDGSDRVRALPSRVPELDGASQIASHAIASQTCALVEDGNIVCWGAYGVARAGGLTRLGDGVVRLPRVDAVREIAVGPWEVCAVTTEGFVHCYRQSLASARGDADAAVYDRPLRVPRLTTAQRISVGPLHTCAVLEEGDVACWGANGGGQLGDGTRVNRTTPALVTVLSGLSELDAR